jgi:CheY-like chemotaxis protein
MVLFKRIVALLVHSPRGMAKERILVVTPVMETASWLSELLVGQGHSVDTSTDGAAAFRRVWDEDFDAIVAEVGVPGIDGRDLHMAFQNTWPELGDRMVFVCEASTFDVDEYVTRTGVPCVPSPITGLALRAALNRVRPPAPIRTLV